VACLRHEFRLHAIRFSFYADVTNQNRNKSMWMRLCTRCVHHDWCVAVVKPVELKSPARRIIAFRESEDATSHMRGKLVKRTTSAEYGVVFAKSLDRSLIRKPRLTMRIDENHRIGECVEKFRAFFGAEFNRARFENQLSVVRTYGDCCGCRRE
jgi:hypothetical protein